LFSLSFLSSLVSLSRIQLGSSLTDSSLNGSQHLTSDPTSHHSHPSSRRNQPSSSSNNNTNSNNAGDSSSGAIPIPKTGDELVTDHPPVLIDITEESWFENERQGSLNQDDFDTIQRQLFGQKSSYLYERMMNSPKKDKEKGDKGKKEKENEEEQTPVSTSSIAISKLSFDSPATTGKREEREERDNGPTTSMSDLSAFSPMNSAQKSLLERSGSFGEEGGGSGNFKMLKRGFSLDMPFELEMEDPPSSSDQNHNNSNTLSSKEDDSSNKILTQIPSFPSSLHHQQPRESPEVRERKSSLEREKRSQQSTPVSIPSSKGGTNRRDRTESYHSKASESSSQRRRSFLDESLLGEDDDEDEEGEDRYGEDALMADIRRKENDDDDNEREGERQGTEAEDEEEGEGEEDSYDIGEDGEEEEEYSLAVSEAIPIERTPKKGGSHHKLKKSSLSRVAADLLLFQHQSPGSLLVNTPPRRERHSSSYLIQAGLLQEGTGTTPIKANNILSSTSPTHHHQLTHHPQTVEQQGKPFLAFI
jgi:hypothetical protein